MGAGLRAHDARSGTALLLLCFLQRLAQRERHGGGLLWSRARNLTGFGPAPVSPLTGGTVAAVPRTLHGRLGGLRAALQLLPQAEPYLSLPDLQDLDLHRVPRR